MSKNIGNMNKNIQEAFYDFCLNILMLFFQDNCFNTSFDKLKKDESEEILKRLNKFYGFEESTKMSKEDFFFSFIQKFNKIQNLFRKLYPKHGSNGCF